MVQNVIQRVFHFKYRIYSKKRLSAYIYIYFFPLCGY